MSVTIQDGLTEPRLGQDAIGPDNSVPHYIKTSTKINELMNVRILSIVERVSYQSGKCYYEAKITIMDLAYKKNIDDARESPAIKIVEGLVYLGAEVQVYNPYVPLLITRAGTFLSVGIIEGDLSGDECAIFLVDHDTFKEISIDWVNDHMVSPVVVGCKICLLIGRGRVSGNWQECTKICSIRSLSPVSEGFREKRY